MQKLAEGITWLNKRLSLLIVMILAGFIMVFQMMCLLWFELDARLTSSIAGYEAAQSRPVFGLGRSRTIRG